MKKIIFAGLFAFSAIALHAQDLKKAKNYLQSKQLDKAKTEIDNYVSANSASAEGYYVQSKIYGAIAADPKFATLDPEARVHAFDAFKKAMTANTDNKLLLILTQENYQPIFFLYTNGSESAAAEFNSAASSMNKEGFQKALKLYLQTNEVGRYINENQWAALGTVDTPLVLNIVRAAIYADNRPVALQYAKQLANAGIHSYKGDASGYDIVYKWLASYYSEKNDDANIEKYTAAGKKFFPADEYFDEVLLEHYSNTKNYANLFKSYESLISAHPDSVKYHLQYASDIIQLLYSDSAGLNKAPYKQKFETEIGIALKADNNSRDANLLLGHYYYNSGADLQNESKAIKDPAKKTAKLNEAKESVKKAVPYFEKVIASYETGYKKADKSKYKSLMNIMQELYEFLGQRDKLTAYQNKYDSADSKFVNP